MATCKKCGGKKEESDGICDYCHKAQERPSTNQVVGRKAAIMPCKKCGGNKAESDGICDYCHKAQEDQNIIPYFSNYTYFVTGAPKFT